jgi:hypothetical protein
MARLERHLTQEGFAVLNLNYPSTSADLDSLADGIHEHVSEFAGRMGLLHVVGFSMGDC